MVDELVFAEENGDSNAGGVAPWNVLVVDDDADVHAVTRLALRNLTYNGRGVALLHAHSAAEARRLIVERDDIALAFVDVVMETEDAGLRLVKDIRERYGNRLTRLVLRTGQPGSAPERQVIVDYDINDYKAKTELTAQRLWTTVVASLRAYEQVSALEKSRRGLEQILAGASELLHMRSIETFANGVLTQIAALLGIGDDGMLCVSRGLLDDLVVFAASGLFDGCAGRPLDLAAPNEVQREVAEVMSEGESRFGARSSTLYVRTTNGRAVVVHVRHTRPLELIERRLVEVFVGQVAVGIDNLSLFDDIKRAHRATVESMAVLAELRDPETHAHVVRVATMTERVTRRLGEGGPYAAQIDDRLIDAIGLASVMHDVGKASTPDEVLRKPGPLTSGERAVMEQHAVTGRELLERAGRIAGETSYLRLGAEIAGAHHERWDGTGYPNRLAADQIPLPARIVAVADVYDALVNRRVYKEAWSHDEAIAYILGEKGKHFDPHVVDAFLDVVEEVTATLG